ncbi:MAG: formyltetrahydrofolate deformylase [Candidatus Omnitrophica bacterium]|nr:formyltetrahydrofolate deformylase [Candidatus Omnitrophota bacterium]MBU1784076.1 formyltetrahydrofolate deformylase [Candidatus Omnitrophota bacterium]
MSMQTVILLFQCADQKGIVAEVSDFIFRHDGNIITADQYSTDPENGHFFLRVEFYIDETLHDKKSLEAGLTPVAGHFNADWKMYYKHERLRMGILVSKPDHCLVDLLYRWRSGELDVDIPFVISNYEGHRNIVKQYNIPFYFIAATKDDRREDETLKHASRDSDFLILARYMLILSGDFLDKYGKDIINIHHSFLPSFKGAAPYRQAFERGVKVIGATAHFVTETLDEGAIISQIVEGVSHKDGVDDLERKGKNMEKQALSHAVYNYIDYRIIKYRNKTIVF